MSEEWQRAGKESNILERKAVNTAAIHKHFKQHQEDVFFSLQSHIKRQRDRQV